MLGPTNYNTATKRAPDGLLLSHSSTAPFENRSKSQSKYLINASSSTTTRVSSDSYQSPSGTSLTLMRAEAVCPQSFSYVCITPASSLGMTAKNRTRKSLVLVRHRRPRFLSWPNNSILLGLSTSSQHSPHPSEPTALPHHPMKQPAASLCSLPHTGCIVHAAGSSPGWELRYNPRGCPYDVDHNTRSTTWTRPSLNLSALISAAYAPSSPNATNVDGTYADGRPYFVDHRMRTTIWNDPRRTSAEGERRPR